MKILHIVSGDLGQGGAERLVIDLAVAQQKYGHQVSVACFRQISDNRKDIPKSLNVHSFSKKKGFSWKLSFQIVSYLRKEQPDVVNCHLPAVFMYMVMPILFLNEIRFFYTIHTMPHQEEKRGWVIKLKKYFYKSGKLCPIAIAKPVQKEFTEIYKLPIELIYNGSVQPQKTAMYEDVKKEVESYKNDANTTVFVAVGRLSIEKNHILLMKVFKKLQEKERNVILLVLGSHFDNTELKKCQALQPSNVYFLGSKTNVRDYLCCSDVFCMSSLYEGMPLSLVEAMSVGLPIICTPVGGLPDLVTDGVNGFLSKSLETDDYVEAIEKYLSLTFSEKKIISETNVQTFKEKYSIEQCAQSYLNLYNRL